LAPVLKDLTLGKDNAPIIEVMRKDSVPKEAGPLPVLLPVQDLGMSVWKFPKPWY
jgi:hypothetical protein